jgi:hypothetical protein
LTFQPGGGAEFAVVKANGSLEIKRRNDKVEELRSGGSLYLREAQYTEHQWWTEKDGFPNLKGQIAGSVIMKNGAVLPDTAKAKQELQGQGFEVKQNTIDTETNKSLTTGLPGEVFCDTRVHAFDAAAYRSQANYIFDFDSDGKPRLTIQNVKLRPGGGASEVSIDKANIDLKTVDPVSGTKPGDMKLRLIQGKKFLGCSNHAAVGLESVGHHQIPARHCPVHRPGHHRWRGWQPRRALQHHPGYGRRDPDRQRPWPPDRAQFRLSGGQDVRRRLLPLQPVRVGQQAQDLQLPGA